MKTYAPDAIPIFFNGYGYQGFILAEPANSACFRCSPIGLINFDGAPQTLTTGTNHGSTQLVQQRPRRLIASDSKFPLQPQSTDSILLACEMPHCSEPECQREVAANTWGPGSIYGTVEFQFAWATLVAGRNIYWVEAMS